MHFFSLFKSLSSLVLFPSSTVTSLGSIWAFDVWSLETFLANAQHGMTHWYWHFGVFVVNVSYLFWSIPVICVYFDVSVPIICIFALIFNLSERISTRLVKKHWHLTASLFDASYYPCCFSGWVKSRFWRASCCWVAIDFFWCWHHETVVVRKRRFGRLLVKHPRCHINVLSWYISIWPTRKSVQHWARFTW